jgi:hypothetical protein
MWKTSVDGWLNRGAPPKSDIYDIPDVYTILQSNHVCMLALPSITEETSVKGRVHASECKVNSFPPATVPLGEMIEIWSERIPTMRWIRMLVRCNPKANKAKWKEKERYVQLSFRSNGRGTFKIRYFVARRNKSMAIKSISSKAFEVCSNTASPICLRMTLKSITFYFWIDVITCNCALIVFEYANCIINWANDGILVLFFTVIIVKKIVVI